MAWMNEEGTGKVDTSVLEERPRLRPESMQGTGVRGIEEKAPEVPEIGEGD